MRRREFLSVLSGAAAWPVVARAQQPKMPVIGLLGTAANAAYVDAIRRGLKETGFVEGNNLSMEYRWAEGHYDRLHSMAAELVSRQVSLIVTSGGALPAMAAKAATSTIPIVFHMGDDPVRVGVVASVNRPSGNVTGVSFLSVVSATKRIELLGALAPKAKVIGVLIHPDNPAAQSTVKDLQAAARALGLQLYAVTARDETDIDAAFANLVQKGAEALISAPDPVFRLHTAKIIAMAEHYALPTMYPTRDFVVAGGLISYGADIVDAYREEGVYAGRILKGMKPADLPVLQSAKFQLVINTRTAKQLGLGVSDKLLALADEVIE